LFGGGEGLPGQLVAMGGTAGGACSGRRQPGLLALLA